MRNALKATLEAFAAKEADSKSWLETIKKRIDNINSHDAKINVKNIIAQLPSGLVSVPATFYRYVIELRNTLVHEMSRLKNSTIMDWHFLSRS